MKVRALSEASAAWRGGYMIADVLMDAALDSVKMLPFLLAAFLLMAGEIFRGIYEPAAG